ncbi:hypothetical protein [Alsobacter sp. R-9]
MADIREDILERLVEIGEGMALVTTVTRNARNISDIDAPALVILDGDEALIETDIGVGRPPSGMTRIAMTPEMIIKLDGLPEAVGPALNAARAELVKAVLTDVTLAELVTNGGWIRYLGCQTQLAYGRQMVGEMAVAFSFTYPLKASTL